MDLRAKAKEKLETLQQKADKTVGALMGRPAELLDEEDAARLRRRAGITALWCVTGFIFQGTTALFSSRPFGIAMLLASGRSGAMAVFAGAVAGALASGQGGLAQAVILGMVLGARLLFSARVAGEEDEPLPLFGEPLHLRAAVAVFAAFLAGVYNVVVYEFHFRGVMALLFGLLPSTFPSGPRMSESSFWSLTASLRLVATAALQLRKIFVASSKSTNAKAFSLLPPLQ